MIKPLEIFLVFRLSQQNWTQKELHIRPCLRAI